MQTDFANFKGDSYEYCKSGQKKKFTVQKKVLWLYENVDNFSNRRVI